MGLPAAMTSFPQWEKIPILTLDLSLELFKLLQHYLYACFATILSFIMGIKCFTTNRFTSTFTRNTTNGKHRLQQPLFMPTLWSTFLLEFYQLQLDFLL